MNQKMFPEYLYNKKNYIINKKNHFKDSMLGQIIKITTNEIEILWHSYNPKIQAKGISKYDVSEFNKNVIPFLITDRSFDFKDEESNELKTKLNKWFEVENILYTSDQHRVEVVKCIEIVKTEIGVSDDIASAIIKSKIARNKLNYIKLKSKEYISLADDVIEFENKKRYLSSISDEIKKQSSRINYVISHGQTVGNYRERLFVSVLRKYIPKKFHIATGFIEGCHKQIDIIIYDQHNYIPVFREDDLVVVKKESVIATIEIKTTLDSTTLKDSLNGIKIISDASMCSVPFFKGVYAFNSEYKNETLIKNIVDFYNTNPIMGVYEHIDAICVPQNHCLYVDYNNLDSNDNSCPTLYTVKDLKGITVGESFFFQKLFTYIEVDRIAKKTNKLFFEELNSTSQSISNKILTKKDWTPFYTFFSEYKTVKHLNPDTDLEEIEKINIINVKRRIKSVNNWLNGELSRDKLTDLYNNNN